MDARAAARAWVDAWERAWPVGDIEALEPVYADDAVFYSAPFRDRERPRDYVLWAFAEQDSAECRFGEPVVDGDRAAVDWWAVMIAPDAEEATIAGTSLLRFDADGRVVEQRDVWELQDGRRNLPDWAPAAEAGRSRQQVRQLRLVVTAPDYDEAVALYRDVLGLREREAYSLPEGRVSILEAGVATLELTDPGHAAYIDEVEVGRRVAGHIRVAFEVDDSAATTRTLEAAGATVIAEPRRTPWNSLNARLEGAAGLQLTLFTELGV